MILCTVASPTPGARKLLRTVQTLQAIRRIYRAGRTQVSQSLIHHLKLGRAHAHVLFQSLVELPYAFVRLPPNGDEVMPQAFNSNEVNSLIEDRSVRQGQPHALG